MKHIGIVRADTLVGIINWLGIPLVLMYVLSMLVAPWIAGRGDWAYVQAVWDRWQSLNVGLLAFISSVLALNISRFNAHKQMERRFIAARAFLPEALSELTSYCKLSAALLCEAWQRPENPENGLNPPLVPDLPSLPESYKETFSRCIEAAEPDVGDYLAYLLMRLQIHHARLTTFRGPRAAGDRTIMVRENLRSYLYRLAELQALINRLFEFARGTESFNGSDLNWDDYRNAYRNLDILIDNYDDLSGFTQRAIDRIRSSKAG